MASIILKNLCCDVQNISSGLKLNCTLWDEFVEQMTKYIQDTLESSIIRDITCKDKETG